MTKVGSPTKCFAHSSQGNSESPRYLTNRKSKSAISYPAKVELKPIAGQVEGCSPTITQARCHVGEVFDGLPAKIKSIQIRLQREEDRLDR